MLLRRLSGRKINAKVLSRGRTWKGRTLVVRWMKGAPAKADVNPQQKAVYLGTFASAKMEKSSVKRNRMRRRCREAMRRALKERADLPTVQLLMSPRSASLYAPFSDIEHDVRDFLSVLSPDGTGQAQ